MSKISWNQAEIMARARQGTMRGIVRWIGAVEQRAVDLILDPPKTGQIYRRRGVSHQASAPGEAPANWTGRLVNSRRIDLFEPELRARLNFSTEYALPLEVGTAKMEPRPYARRALAETREEGAAYVRAEIGDALK